MISTLILFSILQATFSNESPIQYDNSDPIASHPQMMGLVDGIYERNVRRGLTNPDVLNAEDRQNILDLHNKIRSETARGLYQGAGSLLPRAANMAELKYSLLLEKVATDWSGNCNFEHRSSGGQSCASAMARFKQSTPPEWSSGDVSGCGENLYGSGADPAWTVMFGDKDYGIRGGIEDSWCIDEAKTWTYGPSGGSAGHYTAVIWDDTRYVGCGFKQCSSGWMKNMFTCNYFPAGNCHGCYGKKGPYVTGEPCSDCPSDLPSCTTGTNAGLCTDGGSNPSPTPQPVTAPTPPPVRSPTNNPATAPTDNNNPTTTPSPTTTTTRTPTRQTTTPPPTEPSNCLQISGFGGDLASLNGLWRADGSDWKKGVFTLTHYSGYNGFYGSGQSNPDWQTYGWCQASNIFECSGRTWSGYSSYDFSPTFVGASCGNNGGNNPSPTPRPTPPADDLACLKIEQLDINVQVNAEWKTFNDGEWTRRSQDFGGYPSYEWSEGPYYLYTLPQYNWYTISEQIGSMSGLRGWCGSDFGTNIGVFDCDGQFADDSNCVFRSCNSGAFNFNPCLDNAEQGLCFYKNNNQEEEAMEFSIYEEEGCLNDQAVYIHTNNSDINFYIHYDAEYVMWKLSINKVESNSIYVCSKKNLLECTEGSWIKMISGFGIQSFEAMETAKIEACEVITDDSSVKEENGISTGMIVLIIVLVVLSVVLIIGGIFFYRKNKMKKEVTFDHRTKDRTGDKIPMTTETFEDKQGDTVNIGTDDEAEEL
eukprot:473888_1